MFQGLKWSLKIFQIVEANNLAAEIDDEIGIVHKFAKDKYSKRFPELDTLVVQPLDYLLTAKELMNKVTQNLMGLGKLWALKRVFRQSF